MAGRVTGFDWKLCYSIRPAMEESRAKNKSERIKVRLLSPVRKVSGTVPIRFIPRGSRKSKVTEGHDLILVQGLPSEVNYPISTRKHWEQPETDVDLVIADYLHFAKYGQTHFEEMPRTDCRGETIICACCVDRNNENLQKRYPMQHPSTSINAKDLPEHHTKRRELQGQTLVKSNFPHIEFVSSIFGGVSSQHISANQISRRHALQSWSYYQPTPNPRTFLNPESNRPFVQHTSKITARDKAHHRYITTKVIQASIKYEDNMKKLQEHFENGFALPKGTVYLRE